MGCCSSKPKALPPQAPGAEQNVVAPTAATGPIKSAYPDHHQVSETMIRAQFHHHSVKGGAGKAMVTDEELLAYYGLKHATPEALAMLRTHFDDQPAAGGGPSGAGGAGQGAQGGGIGEEQFVRGVLSIHGVSLGGGGGGAELAHALWDGDGDGMVSPADMRSVLRSMLRQAMKGCPAHELDNLADDIDLRPQHVDTDELVDRAVDDLVKEAMAHASDPKKGLSPKEFQAWIQATGHARPSGAAEQAGAGGGAVISAAPGAKKTKKQAKNQATGPAGAAGARATATR